MSTSSYIQDIKQILALARQKAYVAINAAMVEAYWLIGKRIVEQEQQGEKRAAYGEGLLKELSIALNEEFGKGFSYANLRNFRQFYLTFPDQNICYTVCSKLSWSHNRLIIRVSNEQARLYYSQEAMQKNWSVRWSVILIRCITNACFLPEISLESYNPLRQLTNNSHMILSKTRMYLNF